MRLTISKKISFLLLLMVIIAVVNILIIYYYQNLQEFDLYIINIAGRQRMLSQKISKLALSVANGNDSDRQLLSGPIGLYDSSLKILDHGGRMEGNIVPPAPGIIKSLFEENKGLWDLFKENANIVAKESRDNRVFSEAIGYIRQNDDELLRVNNEITLMFEQIFSEKVLRLRILLIIMLVFDIFIFLMGYIMAVRIAQPIRDLSKFARKIGEGYFSQKIDIPRSKDEVRDLANAFDKMIDDLQKTTVSINYFDNILKSMADCLVVVNSDAIIKTVNQASLSLLGYQEEELTGAHMSKIIAEAEEGEVEQLFSRMGIDLFKKGFVHNVENTYLTKVGRKIPVLFSGSVICDNEGKVQWIVCMAQDMTERKQAEKKLRNLSQAMEQSSASVILTNVEGKIEFVNPKFTELTGYSQEEVLDKSPSLLKSGKQSSSVYKNLWETITSGKEWRGELHNKKKNGEFFWEFTSISAIKDENGKMTHFLAVKEDITGRKRMEQEIHSKSELINLMQEVTIATNEASTVGEALQVSLDKVCDYMDWPVGHAYIVDSTGKLLPSRLWHIKNPQQFETFRKITEVTPFVPGKGLPGRVLAKGKPSWIADVTKDPNFPRAKLAKDIGVKAGFALPVLEGKKVVAVLEFFSEMVIEPDESSLESLSNLGIQLGRLTERKRAEEEMKKLNCSLEKYASEMEHLAEERAKQLVHADRMVNMGTLAAGVAHEINNPVGFISNNLQLFESLWGRSIKACIEKAKGENGDENLSVVLDEMPGMVKAMREGTKRISTIVRKLSTYSRVQEETFKEASIGECIKNAIVFCSFGATMKYKVEVQVKVQEGIPNIMISRNEIEQVFINLFNNAAHSMEIIIDDRKPTLKISAVHVEGEIVIETTDNGIGMDEMTLDKIFNPFYTTKEAGKGTGLGLSICRGIIENHRGTMKVSSTLGKGTTFTVTLPLDPQKKERRKKDKKIPGGLRWEDELIRA